MRLTRMITLAAATAALAVGSAAPALAATTVTVDQRDVGVDWFAEDVRGDGAYAFVDDHGAPAGLGDGALELTTGNDNADKAQLVTHQDVVPLADAGAVSYWTYQAPTHTGNAVGAPSFQLQVDLDGTLGDGAGFTTLVYEPYWNGSVAPATWQQWDVATGRLWSSRTVGGLTAGAGGPPFYTLADVVALNPDAVVVGHGVNVGTYNPGYVVAADGVTFGDTTYDFEPHVLTKEDCKKGGWATYWEDGTFRNQGDCVSHFASGRG